MSTKNLNNSKLNSSVKENQVIVQGFKNPNPIVI
jgi:hypothetical protein